MFGKYYDCRVSRHFVQLYSKVPYLDTEIFNVQADLLKQQRLANDRTSLTRQALERTNLKAERLSSSLRDSRLRRESISASNYQVIPKKCVDIPAPMFRRSQKDNSYVKSPQRKRLEDILKSNSTQADSRLRSSNRWS